VRRDRRFEFDKRRQLFIRTNNKAPTVAAMSVHGEHSSGVTLLAQPQDQPAALSLSAIISQYFRTLET
jgi:hypothetical protein